MRTHVRLAAVLAVVVPAATAGAWGPRARLAIVDTATHILAREERIPLNNLERSILDGASVPAGALTTLCPHAETDPIRAIEAEMGLLQRMYRGRVDPYLAFRLGVLGKLVAQVSAPMATAGATYGNLYYADADTQITGVSLQPSARREVEPLGYFRGVQQAATANDEAIVRDYKRGVGFDGVAKGAFAAHANRSVDAVADVWHTILTQRVKLTNVPDAR
ncbi:MAG TPA: hypothetical protein HPP77_09425, partial [Candidatus Hydrogenedentes bacterium]|nr:hypothetical protein [Candidatus Hydrogenedentota bacterium]